MSAVSNDTEESPDTMGRILPNGKLQQCRASSTETNRVVPWGLRKGEMVV